MLVAGAQGAPRPRAGPSPPELVPAYGRSTNLLWPSERTRAPRRGSVMSNGHLPVRPDLEQLRRQAKDVLRTMRRADPSAKLAGAQHALARSYGIASWPRLVVACRLTDAIWRD